MAKKEKLTPIPRGRKVQAPVPDGPVDSSTAAPDLSYIDGPLRALAVRCSELVFHPKNPRKHSEEHIADIAASLKINGQVKNIIASMRTGRPVVVCGNGTLRAALSLGWEWIACTMRDMTEARENELIVIDNVTGADPDWDKALLAEMLKDVDTGNDERLDAMMADLAKDEGLFEGDAVASPGEFKEYGEDIPTDRECPKCGYKWSSGK